MLYGAPNRGLLKEPQDKISIATAGEEVALEGKEWKMYIVEKVVFKFLHRVHQ